MGYRFQLKALDDIVDRLINCLGDYPARPNAQLGGLARVEHHVAKLRGISF
jgi:hypothetical protein